MEYHFELFAHRADWLSSEELAKRRVMGAISFPASGLGRWEHGHKLLGADDVGPQSNGIL